MQTSETVPSREVGAGAAGGATAGATPLAGADTVLSPPSAQGVGVSTQAARIVPLTIIVGLGAGLAGMGMAMLLHVVQHLAFGYSLDAIIGRTSFLEGVKAASVHRRLLALAACGALAATGWCLVYAYGRPLVSISQVVRGRDPTMPLATLAHALLQILTVGLGSPLGREVAPREVGALLAALASRLVGLCPSDIRIMIACGAGAGLAAVYNVPLGGAFFTLEVLLRTFELSVAAIALATSVIAACVAWIGLGNEAQYAFPHFSIGASLVCWSVLTGPVFGFAGSWYRRLAAAARAKAPRDLRLIPWCLTVFTAIGVVSIPFPEILGNGKGPIQLGFQGHLDFRLAATLLLLKIAATTACLRAGAEGGMLTPGMTIGALGATVLGLAWSLLWPGTPPGAFALVGAAAFLSASMAMPLTAVVLVMEFTRMDHDFLIPVLFAVAGSMAVQRFRL